MGALKSGGQGSVYKGRRTGEIITAIKLLPTPIFSENGEDKHFMDFQNEVAKLKKVNEVPNPHVVKILSSGITESGSFPFIEMEYIEGPDLEELLKPPHDPVFTIKEAIKVADQLSHALAHCHKVDVKHGDIKSNNVKYNRHTGNYVLLDFGLAIMSDEQRRTSLRHAGAIEFMAPEQSEGQMLFQSDVYSFGVVLFELLAGVVPFPLADKGETARNMVMVAHMENPAPDVLLLRKENLPQSWPVERREHERQVPDWLVSMIYKCLEKDPRKRFADGVELHQYVVLNSTLAANGDSDEQLVLLQRKNQQLLQEKEELQQRLKQYQMASQSREAEWQQKNYRATVPESRPAPKKNFGKNIIATIATALILCTLIFLVAKSRSNTKPAATKKVASNKSVTPPERTRRVIGQYKVLAEKAYFHNEPDAASRRTAYMIPSNDVVTALDEKNNFIYAEFTNSRGQTSKGWLRKQDLVPLEQWLRSNKIQSEARPAEQDINNQLQEARSLLANNQVKEALYIYSYLSEKEVPEAMYHYGNLALQNKNEDVDCEEALRLLNEASQKGYTPAKRTLGFLYIFARNEDVLRISNYNHCEYEKSVFKGSKLLMEAVLAGDSTAKRILDEVNIRRSTGEEENQ